MPNPGLIDLYTTQFTSLLEAKLQQTGSLLRGLVNEGYYVGKQASPINQLAAVSSRAPAGRFAPIQPVQSDFTRRWVFPTDRELPQLVDNFDQLKTVVDPQSEYVEIASMAFGRDWDDALIAAATGTSQIGVDAGGLSGEAFDTASFQVAANFGASAAVGLTVAKLNEARRILEHQHNELDRDPACLVIGSQQHADLRNQAQVTSSDFNTYGGVLVEGMVTRYMGFTVKVSERLPTITDKNANANSRGCFVFVKSGLHLGMWKDKTVKISQRDDLSSQPWQVYSAHSYGATRTQLGKVIQIAALDTIGADITV